MSTRCRRLNQLHILELMVTTLVPCCSAAGGSVSTGRRRLSQLHILKLMVTTLVPCRCDRWDLLRWLEAASSVPLLSSAALLL